MSGSSTFSRLTSVYSLPPALLSTLSVRSIAAQLAGTTADAEADGESQAGPSRPAQQQSAAVKLPSGTLSCQSCPNATFETVEEQRTHFKSDWHRYNAKARLEGKKVVGVEEWDNLVEGVSSISGSASDTSSGSTASDKVTRLLRKQNLNSNSANGEVDSDEEAEAVDRQRRALLRTAIIWFSPTKPLPELGIPADTQFGVHRALFPPFEQASDYLRELSRMQLKGGGEEDDERRITLLMVAGGHFAGMVVGLRPRAKNERQEVKGAGEVRVIKHKTFHRYTTRKKQGGSQALNDNAKSKAVSAGAMLRRYGEQALQEEIRALMKEWAEDLDASERIFLRASTHGKRSFWGYEGAVLEKTDPRIRVFPFPTRRPTLAELLRCWHELTRVKVSHLTSEALQAQDEAYIASLQPKRQAIKPIQAPTPAPSAPAVPKLSPEEEARLDRQKRLAEMIRKGRLDALKPFIEKYRSEITPDALGLAASSDQEDVLRYLLEEVRLDATQPIEGNKRAYDLSASKGIRNVFRRIAYNHPEWWNWQDARVPSGLSEEMEAEQDRKKNERRKGLREKMKERERNRAEANPEEEVVVKPEPVIAPVPQATREGPQKLGGRVGGEGLGGMTREMRMKIERERRARAAEARLK